MKSLVRKQTKASPRSDRSAPVERPRQQTKLAQCCAKTSKHVAGCHD